MGNNLCRSRRVNRLFRDASYHKAVVLGKRRVKDGECAAIWNRRGEVRNVVGPKLVYISFSDVRFLDKFTANQTEYLVVCFLDGRKEHVRGPSSIFLDPVIHKSVEVKPAISLNANEVMVVYREVDNCRDKGFFAPAEGGCEGQASSKTIAVAESVDSVVPHGEQAVTRHIIKGPSMFTPQANEWVHEFSWHGSNNRMDDARTMIKDGLKLTKIRTLPDQLYYNVTSCRTIDDAQLCVKLMVFFQLEDLERMLDQTHDPIGDFVNAVSADVISFTAGNTFESFVKRSGELNDLRAFPMLVERAAAIGYKIDKVVFRGYKASEQLQAMHDSAIKTRTKLNLEAKTAEQQQSIEDLKLQARLSRADKEREMESANQKHLRELKSLAHAEDLRQANEESAAAQERQRQEDTQRVAFYKDMAAQGVDLTQYLCAKERRGEKVISIEAGATAAGIPHLHLNE